MSAHRIPIEDAEAIAVAACLKRLPYMDRYYRCKCVSCELQFSQLNGVWAYRTEVKITRHGGLFWNVQSRHTGHVQIDAASGDVVGIRIMDT